MTNIYITPQERALLNVIASSESGYSGIDPYRALYGGGMFTGFDAHPNQFQTISSGPNKGHKTSAAGRYQFLGSTWDTVSSAAGLNDFSPASQDMGAIWLARDVYRRKTGRNLTSDLATNDPATLSKIASTLSGTWTSLPSGIEQGQNSDAFLSRYNAALSGPAQAGASMMQDFGGVLPQFQSNLDRMIADAKAAGHDISVGNSYRSPATQAQIISNNWYKFSLNPADRARWQDDVATLGPIAAGQKWEPIFTAATRTQDDGYGTPMRNWIALPGSSNHQKGAAADLKYGNDAASTWVHENAAKYGLAFPLGNEPWHVELAGFREGADYNNSLSASMDDAASTGSTDPSTKGAGPAPKRSAFADLVYASFTPISAPANSLIKTNPTADPHDRT